ncbi:MAG: NAD(P)-dependent oxidoreductase [bacterium]
MSVGFIGLGIMGTPMAARFLNSGNTLVVSNRTRAKAEALITCGSQWCTTSSDVARQCEVVFTMVSTPDALRHVALGSEGILSGFTSGGIHVDTSTVSPMLTEELETVYQKNGCSFLHAPVLGSIPQATEGTLLLFVGGNNKAYLRVQPLLQLLSQKIWRFEQASQASHMKLLCNSFIAGMITTLAQAIVYSLEQRQNQGAV